MSEIDEFVSVGEIDEADDEVEAKRSDNAKRQMRWRAKRDLEMQSLTVKKQLKLIAARTAALSATIKAAEEAKLRLTPEQREIFDSEVFQEGLEDGSSAGLRSLQGQMYESVEWAKSGDLSAVVSVRGWELHVDWVSEYYRDFVDTFPWAKALVYPRAYSPVAEGPREYPLSEFFAAVAKWSAFRDHDPSLTLPDEPVEPVKRGRGRRTTESTPAADLNEVANQAAERAAHWEAVIKREAARKITEPDPEIVKSWSTPPAVNQRTHWGGIAAERASREIARDVEEALPSKPVFFPRQNEQEKART